LGRRLGDKLAVHGVGRKVGAVGPAHHAELVHRHLTEYRLVAHLAIKLAGEVYRARNPRRRTRRAAGISGAGRSLRHAASSDLLQWADILNRLSPKSHGCASGRAGSARAAAIGDSVDKAFGGFNGARGIVGRAAGPTL
jgi:hypothetical protein